MVQQCMKMEIIGKTDLEKNRKRNRRRQLQGRTVNPNMEVG